MKYFAALLIAGTAVAYGQTTGVSHPDETVVVTTPAEGTQQPIYAGPGPVTVSPVTTGAVPQGYVSTPALHPPSERPLARAQQTFASSPEDVDAGIVTSVSGPANEIAQGTLLRVRLKEALSTERTKAGSEFMGELTQAVEREGRVLLPAGAMVTGRVSEVTGGRRIAGGAAIHLVPTSVTLPDGVRYGLQAQVVDTDQYKNIKVTGEGTMIRRGHTKETLAVLGLAAGGGAAAGGVLGGPGGALIGAGIGAGVGTVVWLREDRQEEISAGTEIIFSLNVPLVVGAE